MKSLLSRSLLVFLVPCTSFAISATQVLEKVKQNTSSQFEDLNLEMAISKKGESLKRSLNIKKVSDGDKTKSLVKIASPMKLKGLGIYSEIANGSEQQWIYLPSLKKSRRVLKGNRKSSFLDSDLNYEDFSADLYSGYESVIKSEDKKFWIIESTPKSEDASYSKIETKVLKAKFLITNVRYFDSKGKLEKTLAASKFKKFGGIWRATQVLVKKKDSKDRTLLKVTKLSTKKFSSAKVSKAKLEN